MSKPIRLLMADSDTRFSENFCHFLDQQEDVKVVQIVRDGQGVVNGCKETFPDVVFMDLRLPVLDSIKTIQTVLNQNEHIKILVTSTIPNDRYAVEAVKVGAHGYIDKDSGSDYNFMLEAIRQVANGDVFINPALASSILQEFYRLTEQSLEG